MRLTRQRTDHFDKKICMVDNAAIFGNQGQSHDQGIRQIYAILKIEEIIGRPFGVQCQWNFVDFWNKMNAAYISVKIVISVCMRAFVRKPSVDDQLRDVRSAIMRCWIYAEFTPASQVSVYTLANVVSLRHRVQDPGVVQRAIVGVEPTVHEDCVGRRVATVTRTGTKQIQSVSSLIVVPLLPIHPPLCLSFIPHYSETPTRFLVTWVLSPFSFRFSLHNDVVVFFSPKAGWGSFGSGGQNAHRHKNKQVALTFKTKSNASSCALWHIFSNDENMRKYVAIKNNRASTIWYRQTRANMLPGSVDGKGGYFSSRQFSPSNQHPSYFSAKRLLPPNHLISDFRFVPFFQVSPWHVPMATLGGGKQERDVRAARGILGAWTHRVTSAALYFIRNSKNSFFSNNSIILNLFGIANQIKWLLGYKLLPKSESGDWSKKQKNIIYSMKKYFSTMINILHNNSMGFFRPHKPPK